MNNINHKKYAKKAIAYLINHIISFHSGEKYVTYGTLAKAIQYPEPYVGSYFGKRIGKTLGVMGHILEEIKLPDWNDRIPFLQALVVGQNAKIPSDGLREFKPNYPFMTKEKKKDYAKMEWDSIFKFGERWYQVLEKLNIKFEMYDSKNITKSKKYNPFGSEGSPEHKRLRDNIANNPQFINLNFENGLTEYPLKSGDSIDVFFQSDDIIIGIEVKSIRSGYDDLERGIFQCIKYREVLKAEKIIEKKDVDIDCYLVYEGDLGKKNMRHAKKLGVKTIKVNFNK